MVIMSNISAKIVADSVSSVNGKRITTFELEYPRFVHSEFMTHRMVSKNAASSRAIPVAAAIQNIRENTAMPVHWGKNQPGMQANEECNEKVRTYTSICDGKDIFASREEAWLDAMDSAVSWAEEFAAAGYHKQIVNRITEPFQMIKVVATATEWDNFFWLRKHADAQPEIRVLAEKMWEALQDSVPVKLYPGDWHTPYYESGYWTDKNGESGVDDVGNTWEVALKVSSSMCAQVSYRKADDTLEKALMVYDRLVASKPVHASPFEHQAAPMAYPNSRDVHIFDMGTYPEIEDGVTSERICDGNFSSGNFYGWIQHRQLIKDNACWNYTDD